MLYEVITDGLVEKFEGIISSNGGKITKKENWGLRNLAYRIEKNRKGHYVLLNIDAPSAAVKELERQMGINEDVLRYITIRKDVLEDKPSIIMAGDKDSRRITSYNVCYTKLLRESLIKPDDCKGFGWREAIIN